ncbi:MAG TPA: PEP-CTERM sorting domain-containing protein, partial [Tepidisphaeraceae bacterium]|nr:PEP-CTERM sorting domain-containing protein [Tepidisphaeraceae bacterium]
SHVGRVPPARNFGNGEKKLRTITLSSFAVLALAANSAMAGSLLSTTTTDRTAPVGTYFTHVAGQESIVSFTAAPYDSWDLHLDADNVRTNWDIAAALGAPSGSSVTITGIGWDVDLTALGDSWLADNGVAMTATPEGTTGLFLRPGAGTNNPGSGNFASGAMIDLSDNAIPDIVLPTGVLEFQFYESFDDAPDEIDGTWDGGSLMFEATSVNVPEPTTLGVIGLGSLIALRRARRA